MTEAIKFEAINIPLPIETENKNSTNYFNWGADNCYPNFLLDLYRSSPIHSSIINNKVNYIIGNGLKVNGEKINICVNASDTIEDFLHKTIKDYILFNFYCVEVIYNKFGKVIELHHVPAHLIRTNKDKTQFWYSEDWFYRKNLKKYQRWSKNSTDYTSKIFYFDGYFPSLNRVYPEPEYTASIKAIFTDIGTRDFNLNNIKNHFAVSTIITFFRGSNVPDDTQRKILSDIKNVYTGENGNKLIVDFQQVDGKPADVKNISPNDWDKAYIEVKKSAQEDIFIGHEVTSPILFGVKTEGQLGGAKELQDSYEIYKANYINNKRNELIASFKRLFSDTGLVAGAFEFEDKILFKAEVSEALKEKIMTINELRNEIGLSPLVDGNRLISTSASSFSSDEKKSDRQLTQLSEDDFEKVKHLGTHQDEFEFVEEQFAASDDVVKISNYLIDNPKINSLKDLLDVVENDLGISITKSELEGVLKDISQSKLLDVKVNGDTLKITVSTPQTRKTEVLYSYDVREGLGSPKISTSRAFCVKLIDNNRYYTRKEIQQMSELFGYDVFKHCGGFYTNKDGTTTPYCRHNWKRVTVVKK